MEREIKPANEAPQECKWHSKYLTIFGAENQMYQDAGKWLRLGMIDYRGHSGRMLIREPHTQADGLG